MSVVDVVDGARSRHESAINVRLLFLRICCKGVGLVLAHDGHSAAAFARPLWGVKADVGPPLFIDLDL
jgi:hypothetical protein